MSCTSARIGSILNSRQPFGPVDAEGVLNCPEADQLFDRSNLIYKQTTGPMRPTYIIGRKGAGKTAFLIGAADGRHQEQLRTSTIYSEMVATLRRYSERRAPLYTDQIAEIWQALLDHVALAHGCRTASRADRPNELQAMWDYLDSPGGVVDDPMVVAEQFLADLRRRVEDPSSPSSGCARSSTGCSVAARTSAMRAGRPSGCSRPVPTRPPW